MLLPQVPFAGAPDAVNIRQIGHLNPCFDQVEGVALGGGLPERVIAHEQCGIGAAEHGFQSPMTGTIWGSISNSSERMILGEDNLGGIGWVDGKGRDILHAGPEVDRDRLAAGLRPEADIRHDGQCGAIPA